MRFVSAKNAIEVLRTQAVAGSRRTAPRLPTACRMTSPAAYAAARSCQVRTVATGTNYLGVKYPAPQPDVVEAKSHNVLDLFSLKGKVASITGSSSGIGFAIAEAYAQAGADVAIWYNKTDPTEKVKHLTSTYGIKCKAYKAEITNPGEVDKVVQQQIKDFGRVDVFVANAGVIWEGKESVLDEPDTKEWDRVVRTNYDAVFYCAKSIGKHFRERGQGSMVIAGSMSGHVINVPDTMAAYCSSKAAVIHLGKALAMEWAQFARVNIVSPGYMKTRMTAEKQENGAQNWGALTPMGRMGDRRELVGAYLYLGSDASSYVTGSDILVDGGYCVA